MWYLYFPRPLLLAKGRAAPDYYLCSMIKGRVPRTRSLRLVSKNGRGRRAFILFIFPGLDGLPLPTTPSTKRARAGQLNNV